MIVLLALIAAAACFEIPVLDARPPQWVLDQSPPEPFIPVCEYDGAVYNNGNWAWQFVNPFFICNNSTLSNLELLVYEVWTLVYDAKGTILQERDGRLDVKWDASVTSVEGIQV